MACVPSVPLSIPLFVLQEEGAVGLEALGAAAVAWCFLSFPLSIQFSYFKALFSFALLFSQLVFPFACVT